MTIADLFTRARCICGKDVRRSRAVVFEDSTGTQVYFDPDHKACLSEWHLVYANGGLFHIHEGDPADDSALPEAWPINDDPVPHG